ncbi:MAG: thermostable hemolysin [Nitrosomonadales bacterium]|nr:thermostable hemolysin [Nitrosomonadales bacterium]
MNTAISNPTIGLAERPFAVHFSQPDADDRAEIERFISDIFHQAYGAEIKRFKPCLMSLRDQDNKLVAACGFRNAALEPLFLETYLDQPIEAVLSERTGFPVKRSDIVGVGNFSVAEPGMARHLIAAIVTQLHATSKQWAVFTAVPIVRNAFIKMNLNPVILGDADKNRLPPEEQAEWGSYYAQKPQVMAIRRIEQRSKLRIPEAGIPEPITGTRCKTCAMILRQKMSPSVIDVLIQRGKEQPDSPALVGNRHALTYRELAAAIEQLGAQLRAAPAKTIGLALDNSPLWAVLDLAGLHAGKPVIPLPFFFSAEQIAHSIRDAGIDCIFTDQPEQYRKLLEAAGIETGAAVAHDLNGQTFSEIRLRNIAAKTLPAGTVKVTYTSGTTGHPKGVCLSAGALQHVASSLLAATRGKADDRHVSVLPLSTLLENLAGVYVPLLAGATCHLLPLAEVGLSGSTGLDVKKMLAALIECRATTTILTPQLLHAMVAAIEAGHPAPRQLRFVAVGGAPVAPRLLQRAQALGIPVFEGYGLSECASVVALNTESEHRIGSVGKPLAHARVKFAEDGEILVAGATLLGYTGAAPLQPGEFWPTGDIGQLDEQGFLHLTGRKKNIFITSFGRNVSPEWVERELTLHPAIAQAAVFGEARPWNVAVIVLRGNTPEALDAVNLAIAEANNVLPDYAQVKYWLPAQAPFLPQNGQLTANGRLKREAIWSLYQAAIEQLYKEKSDDGL